MTLIIRKSELVVKIRVYNLLLFGHELVEEMDRLVRGIVTGEGRPRRLSVLILLLICRTCLACRRSLPEWPMAGGKGVSHDFTNDKMMTFVSIFPSKLPRISKDKELMCRFHTDLSTLIYELFDYLMVCRPNCPWYVV